MGRGLSALLQTNTATTGQDAGAKEVVSGIFEVAIGDIEANPKQPRVHFEPEHLQELAASIAALGMKWISATKGVLILADRTFFEISPRASAALTFGAVIRTTSQPASASSMVCLTVASTSRVLVVVID